MKKILIISALLTWVCAFQTGCIAGRRVMALPVATATATAPAQKGVVYLEKITDARRFENKPEAPSTPSVDGDVNEMSAEQRSAMIGRQRGGFGNAMGDISLPTGENVQTRTTALFEEALRRRGYSLSGDAADAASKIKIEIKQFWAWCVPWGFGISFEARVTCEVTVTTPSGTRKFEVSGFNRNVGQVASDANWQLAYTRAFEEFLTKLDAELVASGF